MFLRAVAENSICAGDVRNDFIVGVPILLPAAVFFEGSLYTRACVVSLCVVELK